MVSGYIDHFRGLLTNPQSTLTSLKHSSLRSAFIYFFLVWGLFAVLFCIIGRLYLNFFIKTNNEFTQLTFVVTVLVGWLFFGLVIHAVLRVLSGPKSIFKTYMAILYAATPLAVIGWIPLIGGLSFIWALLLIRKAIVEFHEISYGTAIAVIFLSLFIGILTFGMAFFFLPVVATLIIH
jgi:hypothetical protein